MNTTKKAYCRLCAEKKPPRKLVNLQNDTDKWQKIVDKLSRFNIFLDQQENVLPRTVCFLCSKSLESAFDFVATVEHAQATLSDFIMVQVKKEENDSEDNLCNDPPDESMDNTEHIDEEPNTKSEYYDKDVSIEVYNNDINKFNEPCDDKKGFINLTEIEVPGIIEVKMDIEECNNIETKQQAPIDTFCEIQPDKTSLNINTEVHKYKEDSTEKMKSMKLFKADNEYSVDFIDKQVNRLATVPLHAIEKTWKDFIWKCSYCETLFPNVDELQAHSMQFHNACNTYQCTECNSRKVNLNGFIKHVREHRKYLHYSCYKCFMKFTSPHEGRIHKGVHNTSDNICLGCNTTFPNKDELETHTGAYFKNMWKKKIIGHWRDDSFPCNICEKSFKTSVRLLRHNMISHTIRKREHFCEICGKGFYDKFSLSNHMIVHSDTKPYQCEICKHQFKNIYLLRYHAKVHSGEKPFMCDQCDRCFRVKRHLVNHSKIHSDLLSYSCSQCDKKFRTKNYLKNHMRQHTGEKPYSCEICEKNFTGWSNYNKHMKRKHGTDKSKKKRTPLGPHPVDPTTGDVIYPDMEKVLEWKKNLKEPLTKKGRKKQCTKNTSDTPL